MGEKNIGKDAKEKTPILNDGHRVIFKLNLHSLDASRLTGRSDAVNQPAAVPVVPRSRKGGIAHPAAHRSLVGTHTNHSVRQILAQ